MNRTTTSAAGAGLLAGSLLLTACGGGASSSSAGHDMSSMPGTTSSTAPSSSSSRSTQPSASSPAGTPAAGPHNRSDVMFAAMMVPHHAQAITMSETLLAKSSIEPKVRDLATRIKTAQGPEIARMNGWLTGWGQQPMSTDMTGMGHGGMSGMMSEQQMATFKAATGATATRLFLTGMTAHHRGAVQMAKTERAQGTNPEAKQLAQAIITAQQQEITEMALLRS